MSFPTYSGLTPKVDSVDTIYADDVNELQDAIQEIATRSYAAGAHSHSAYSNFGVRAYRDAVASGGLTITNATSQDVISDTQALSSGVNYDLVVSGVAYLSAGTGGSIQIAMEILDGSAGVLWTKVWIGTPTEGGERSVMAYADVGNIPGGQTVTVKMVARRNSVNGTVGSASFAGFFIPRGGGGVV